MRYSSIYTREIHNAHYRGITPFEVIRDEWYRTIIERESKWIKNIEEVEKYAMLKQTVVKPNSIVNFSTKYQRRYYNKNSLDNLVQNQPVEVEKELKAIREQKEVLDVNDWSNGYLKEYEKKKSKKYRGLPSKQVANKIYKAASVFVRSVLSGFVSTRGFRQRSISFCTFTLSESQKHTDAVIIKTFVDFIDHLKKVNNYIIDPVSKKRTKEKALVLDNYLWRAETQENGNIHFHLIADTFLNQDMLRRVWNNYLQNLGYKYSYSAANVNSLKRDKKNNKILNVERYLCKYMTKQPLRNAFKHMKAKELAAFSDEEKYRRPIIGKFWGCSRKILKLEYPKFYDERASEVVKQMKSKMKQIKSEKIPDFIEVFVGDTRKIFLTLDYKFQRWLKEHYLMCLQWLYDEIPIEDDVGFSLN